MRDPMAMLGAFLLGLILAGWWRGHQTRVAEMERDRYRRAFLALADTIEAENAKATAAEDAPRVRGQR